MAAVADAEAAPVVEAAGVVEAVDVVEAVGVSDDEGEAVPALDEDDPQALTEPKASTTARAQPRRNRVGSKAGIAVSMQSEHPRSNGRYVRSLTEIADHDVRDG